ncbi:hypothetical protein ACFS07_36460 [Undibacterium arcticum]|uniref:Uncharacterized protein n=2 Tax=Undibacterium arcticum TaxID=1762892 RepID=A0ABV7F778_9BURK
MIIECIDENTFRTSGRGSIFTLTRRGEGWRVVVENASTRAWRTLGNAQDFGSLVEVERRYKTLRGISPLIAAQFNSMQ